MFAALTLAAVCAWPPLFDLSGPECTPANQEIECKCSEAITWTRVTGAAYYEINRTNPDGTTQFVGDTKWRNRSAFTWVNGDGSITSYPEIHATTWNFAWDLGGPPRPEGARFVYRVRSCSAAGACSAWGTTVAYIAAPYLVRP